MDKIIRIGTTETYDGLRYSIYCHIILTNGELSITGVEGPLKSGNAVGSCGQIYGSIDVDSVTPAKGWTADSIREFLNVWERWHLNYMRAGCEHQRLVDVSRKVEVVSYGLTSDAHNLRKNAENRVAVSAAKGQLRELELTETERALILLENKWFQHEYYPPDADSPLSGCYEVKKRETRPIGQVYHTEHPDGILCKPCEVCGYRYGSAWLREELPQEVIDLLESLPESDTVPAWV